MFNWALPSRLTGTVVGEDALTAHCLICDETTLPACIQNCTFDPTLALNMRVTCHQADTYTYIDGMLLYTHAFCDSRGQ